VTELNDIERRAPSRVLRRVSKTGEQSKGKEAQSKRKQSKEGRSREQSE